MFKNTVFKPSVDTIEWCKKAGIRAVKTMAQTALSLFTVGQIVDDDNVVTCFDQLYAGMAADIAGTTCYKNFHSAPP